MKNHTQNVVKNLFLDSSSKPNFEENEEEEEFSNSQSLIPVRANRPSTVLWNILSFPAGICSKLTIETLDEDVKYVQS